MKGGQSTTCKGTALPTSGPTRHFPPTAWLSNSLLGHRGQFHTQPAPHYRQQNLLMKLQEDRSTRGAAQSLETTFQLHSFEAHKPISSDIILGSKKSPDLSRHVYR